MITEKEFKERFGFEPQQDDLHRVNCDKAGEVGHLMCGVCSNCGQPRFICGCQFQEPQDDLYALGLERVGDELFALADKESQIPKILVFKPVDAQRLGVETDLDAVFIVRERALSDTAYGVIIEESGVGEMLYRPINDETIHEIKARIKNRIMAAVHKGDLFKDLGSIWRHSKENC